MKKITLNLEGCELQKVFLGELSKSLSKCNDLEYIKMDFSKNIKMDVNSEIGEFISNLQFLLKLEYLELKLRNLELVDSGLEKLAVNLLKLNKLSLI